MNLKEKQVNRQINIYAHIYTRVQNIYVCIYIIYIFINLYILINNLNRHFTMSIYAYSCRFIFFNNNKTMPTLTTEHEHQITLIAWLKHAYPNVLAYAIPNGGKRNITTAQKLKAEGVLSGIPDLCLAEPRGGYNGLYIELKLPKKGKLTESQKNIIEKLNQRGYLARVCWGFDDAKATIEGYMNGQAKNDTN